jgi:methyltransferase family protein
MVEAAGIEPAPIRGVSDDQPARWLSGEEGSEAPMAATAPSTANQGQPIDDGEVLHTPLDKSAEMPREQSRRSSGARPLPPALWNSHAVVDTGVNVMGQLPRGFVAWACSVLRCPPREVLHVCSGNLPHTTPGLRVDIRREVLPDVVADGRALPFADESFDGVLIDPPYSKEYADHLYGTEYPRPSALLREAVRVLRPCRFVGMVHFLVPRPEEGLCFVEVHGVMTGCGYRIRALTVFQKEPRGLFGRSA